MSFCTRIRFSTVLLLAVALLGGRTGIAQEPAAQEEDLAGIRAEAQQKQADGNWKEAYEQFRELCLHDENDGAVVGRDLSNGLRCLIQLGRISESDEFVESTIEVHPNNWQLLQAAAGQYLNGHGTGQHFGFIISGEFQRGHRRGGGRQVNSLERDRVRALQLMLRAMPLTADHDNQAEVSGFYQSLANQLLYNRGYSEAWRLQYLTDLSELPEYEEGWPYFRPGSAAPVDREGNPVFHQVAKSWDTATTDGERWRWCLEQVVEYAPRQRNNVRGQFAQFCMNQFGVQSMQQYSYGRPFYGAPAAEDDDDESGTYALHTLKENETIARLASGIKRFDLPDEFNFIKIYQSIAADPKTGGGESALGQLASIFMNRRQYPTAVEYWQQSIREYGDRHGNKSRQVDQIQKSWGAFEGVSTQPAGQGATVEYRFRNGKQVRFRARAIKLEKLLNDVQAYLKSDPGRVDWQKINIGNIGYRLVHQGQEQYLEDGEIASWKLDLQPRKNHFDRRITVATPLKKPGAYLVTATMEGGNVSKIVLWVSDTAIVKKQLSGKVLYYVADAVTGKPIDGLDLEFFGYRVKHLRGKDYQVLTTSFTEKTDADGQVTPDPRDLIPQNYQWLVTARNKDRLAYLGFQNVWYNQIHDQEYKTAKVFAITDRPVYRPKQKVDFKLWVRYAQYDNDDVSRFAGQSFPVEIHNPKGEKISSQLLQCDEYGGIVGEFEVPEDATLGVYRINLVRSGGHPWAYAQNTFRVEEYKKPEFEVTIDAPREPVMLGEKITAKINAQYYFGSPVTNATVKYKVQRHDHSQDWYPVMPWDWCFGSGYWWFSYDYPWYPGWHEWVGCVRPAPWWYHQGRQNPPELVMEQELEIGPDGTLEVVIDTAIAKELHGKKDHKYTITAEVRDQSRRTIVGTGDVLVARKPFKVFTWVDRGYYRVGDVIKANFKAQTLDNKPVQGQGSLTLLKITYDDRNQPIETPVRRWEVDTNVEGVALQQLQAAAKGQYRLSYRLTDSQEHQIEGGYLFTIMGDGNDGSDYRFNAVELIPDKQDYQPGDKVKLQINTARANSTVLLFARPTNGVYLPPTTIYLQGKSEVYELGVVKKDMPNFFVEAVTVADGKVYQETKEIVVPPEKRVLNVEVLPSATDYKPGQKAKVKVRLTDFTGENFQGQTVVAIYDKSVEYISGGSNVPDIRDFFWKWRRNHHPHQETSLARWFQNMTLPGSVAMQSLGVFGATVADELDAMANDDDFARAEVESAELAPADASPAPGVGGFGRGARANALAAKGAMPDAAGAPSQSGPTGTKDRADGDTGADLVEPAVRSNFADTALWVGALMTDRTGIAEVELDMPENLTTWKIKVWGMGHGTRVGSGEAEVVTRKDLIIRLQAPRFFVQKDEVVLSANVHNYLDTEKQVTVSLELPGEQLETMDGVEPTVTVTVPAGGEHRVDWRVNVLDEGLATIRMRALTDEESDAMEMKFSCYVHGMLKTEAWAGTVRPDDALAKVNVSVPAERRPEQSRLEIRYSPTLAGAMVDALPYLAEYPHGCTEQTLNRFLPSVITQKVLLDMGLDLAAIKDKRTNLNAQEIGDDVERAKQWKRFDRNPVFDRDELNRMVKAGIKRLTTMQLGDGGWGWFSGWGERSYPHTTAVVVHGLQLAVHNDVAIAPGVLQRGQDWLERYQDQQTQLIRNAAEKIEPYKASADNLDAFVYMVLVDAGQDNEEMRGYLYRDRNNLAVYSKAMFGLALEKVMDGEKLAMILRNIEQYLVQDEENETAYLKLPADNYWWYWYGSETEANAYYLKLLARVDARGEKNGSRLVKYLLNNRKHATYWRSTRDTAVCVEAFADFIRASGESKPDMVVEIWIDGQKKKEVEITSENLFTYDNKFVMSGTDVTAGAHEVELRRRGEGPVYFNAYLTNFTLEDFITKAGLEVKVTRKYYKLNKVDDTKKAVGDRGQALDQKVEKYHREELSNLTTLTSGDLVEVELSIESKNDYEYLLFEDMKPAGFEAVDVRSGYTRSGLHAYTEFRDNRVVFFVHRLARGNHSVSYRLRAEIPGKFSALPAKASAMYAPELKGNSDEIKLLIED